MSKDRLLAIIYSAILFIHLYVGASGWENWAGISKPFLLITLIAFVFFEVLKKERSSFALLILGGLFFSLLGDVFLIFQENGDYFLYGIGAFMLAHVCYIFAFNKTYLENHEIRLLKRFGWITMVIVAYGYFFFNTIKDFLHDMIGPVLVYTMVISVMIMIALNRFKKVNDASFYWIAFGAFSFLLSDSLIAWNKFVRDLDYAHFMIMATYGVAQYGIARGAIIQIRDTSRISIPKEA